MNVDFANLTPDAVLDSLEGQGYWPTGQLYPLNSYENRVYQVACEDQPTLIAKYYRPQRWSEAQLLEEQVLLSALASAGVPVVAPLELQQPALGQQIGRQGEYFYTLTPRKLGRAPELGDFDTLFQLGELVGRLHQKSRQLPLQHRASVLTGQTARANSGYLQSNWLPGSLKQRYSDLAQQLLDRLEVCLGEQYQQQFITLHGDCHLGNVLMVEGEPLLVDFDDAMPGPAVQDLWMFLSGDSAEQSRQLSELVEGYEQYCEFDRAQLAWIPALRAIRLFHYASWLARRWQDPAFKMAFPWFNSEDYWLQQCNQMQALLLEFEAPVSLGY